MSLLTSWACNRSRVSSTASFLVVSVLSRSDVRRTDWALHDAPYTGTPPQRPHEQRTYYMIVRVCRCVDFTTFYRNWNDVFRVPASQSAAGAAAVVVVCSANDAGMSTERRRHRVLRRGGGVPGVWPRINTQTRGTKHSRAKRVSRQSHRRTHECTNTHARIYTNIRAQTHAEHADGDTNHTHTHATFVRCVWGLWSTMCWGADRMAGGRRRDSESAQVIYRLRNQRRISEMGTNVLFFFRRGKGIGELKTS